MADELYPVPSDLDLGATIRGFSCGQKVFNRYTLLDVVGRGGMGVVWKAHDEELDRDVALKFLPELVTLDKEAVAELKRETRHSLDLTHPHIVRIYDFVQDQTSAAISMEFVNGSTLSSLKVEQPHGCLEVETLAPLIAQLCEALTYAHHKAEVVHRDLKPANLMITHKGDLKLADLGIARSVSDSVSRVTMRGGTSGTLLYMSPQQAMGQPTTVSDDVYALGATIYDLLSGKPPFFSGDIISQLREVVPPSMTERRQQLKIEGAPIPHEWEETVAACLEKSPARRPQNAAEVAHRLGLGPAPAIVTPKANAKLASTGKFAPGPPTSIQVTLPSLPPKSTMIWILVGVLVVLLIAGGIGYYFGVMVPAQKAKEAEIAQQKAVEQEQALEKQQADDAAKKAAADAAAQKAAADAAAVADAKQKQEEDAARLAAARGGFKVNTNPPGATVALGGEQVQTSPATFQSVKLGKYPVKIMLDGYDPVEIPVEITENGFVDLGTINLTRSMGSLQIVATPDGADYELKPATSGTTAATNAKETSFKGKTPAVVNDLPTGTWILTVKSPGFDQAISEVQITKGQQTQFAKDFIVDRATTGLPDNIKSLLTAPQAAGIAALNDADKKQFSDAAAQLFQEYLKANLFRKAKDLDAVLTQAGLTDATRADALTKAEQGWIAANQPAFEADIKTQSFPQARQLLAQQQELSDPSLLDGWQNEFKAAYASFQQTIQPDLDALKLLVQNQDWANADARAAAGEKTYPDDPSYFQFGLQIDKASPNTAARCQNRLARIDLFLNDHLLPSDQEDTLKTDRASFADLVARHKAYQASLDPLTSEIKHQNSQISSLESKRKSEEALKQNYDAGKGVAQIFNSLPFAAITQKSSNDHQANINEIDEEIGKLNGAISGEQNQLTAAQATYTAFTAETVSEAMATKDAPPSDGT